ncbi:hypothetical protein BN7_315 [Wickerhamomyces ciferrii]|uniref:Uncharacterized protein n=1 Tax=Wickerhamomyces ciferrii (strain ATCC 14091 / BCRC 22168 / CBS 111 / JCM 3599 / NBRC 0793 / NRRL Y-1031 F-60-10) TaxID=1206466 RepID=K0KD29_WICCF|nr:uncharacterized protein BN7_315 [Wickerhamomyces ciferrii]CCH40781.1 hypothetical protein BN7_315 [Wickerhamomyces ciferrii]
MLKKENYDINKDHSDEDKTHELSKNSKLEEQMRKSKLFMLFHELLFQSQLEFKYEVNSITKKDFENSIASTKGLQKPEVIIMEREKNGSVKVTKTSWERNRLTNSSNKCSGLYDPKYKRFVPDIDLNFVHNNYSNRSANDELKELLNKAKFNKSSDGLEGISGYKRSSLRCAILENLQENLEEPDVREKIGNLRLYLRYENILLPRKRKISEEDVDKITKIPYLMKKIDDCDTLLYLLGILKPPFKEFSFKLTQISKSANLEDIPNNFIHKLPDKFDLFILEIKYNNESADDNFNELPETIFQEPYKIRLRKDQTMLLRNSLRLSSRTSLRRVISPLKTLNFSNYSNSLSINTQLSRSVSSKRTWIYNYPDLVNGLAETNDKDILNTLMWDNLIKRIQKKNVCYRIQIFCFSRLIILIIIKVQSEVKIFKEMLRKEGYDITRGELSDDEINKIASDSKLMEQYETTKFTFEYHLNSITKEDFENTDKSSDLLRKIKVITLKRRPNGSMTVKKLPILKHGLWNILIRHELPKFLQKISGFNLITRNFPLIKGKFIYTKSSAADDEVKELLNKLDSNKLQNGLKDIEDDELLKAAMLTNLHNILQKPNVREEIDDLRKALQKEGKFNLKKSRLSYGDVGKINSNSTLKKKFDDCEYKLSCTKIPIILMFHFIRYERS